MAEILELVEQEFKITVINMLIININMSNWKVEHIRTDKHCKQGHDTSMKYNKWNLNMW